MNVIDKKNQVTNNQVFGFLQTADFWYAWSVKRNCCRVGFIHLIAPCEQHVNSHHANRLIGVSSLKESVLTCVEHKYTFGKIYG